ncbi:MAG: hypothetical protein ACOH1K_06820, partial [Rhodoglobus sp.]
QRRTGKRRSPHIQPASHSATASNRAGSTGNTARRRTLAPPPASTLGTAQRIRPTGQTWQYQKI